MKIDVEGGQARLYFNGSDYDYYLMHRH
jgi:hypothetical protein